MNFRDIDARSDHSHSDVTHSHTSIESHNSLSLAAYLSAYLQQLSLTKAVIDFNLTPETWSGKFVIVMANLQTLMSSLLTQEMRRR